MMVAWVVLLVLLIAYYILSTYSPGSLAGPASLLLPDLSPRSDMRDFGAPKGPSPCPISSAPLHGVYDYYLRVILMTISLIIHRVCVVCVCVCVCPNTPNNTLDIPDTSLTTVATLAWRL